MGHERTDIPEARRPQALEEANAKPRRLVADTMHDHTTTRRRRICSAENGDARRQADSGCASRQGSRDKRGAGVQRSCRGPVLGLLSQSAADDAALLECPARSPQSGAGSAAVGFARAAARGGTGGEGNASSTISTSDRLVDPRLDAKSVLKAIKKT